MKTRWILPFLAVFAALAITPAFAQAPAIDPALLSKATAGDAAAQLLLGDLYAAGSGPTRTPRQATEDYKQAAEWYRKAAEQGNAAGQIRLAALYRDGKGVEHDMAQAAAWYRKAADQGDVSAQGTLGLLYSIGQGVPQSYVEAYYWLALASGVKGPDQARYDANRQNVGSHITAAELADVTDRVEKWLAAHPRPAAAE
jgi:TPR repeat protein